MSGSTDLQEDPALEAKARELCAAAGQNPDDTLLIGGREVPRWRTFRLLARKALQAART